MARWIASPGRDLHRRVPSRREEKCIMSDKVKKPRTMNIKLDKIEIVSTWGRTTKVMRRAVARVRERFHQEVRWATNLRIIESTRRIYSLEEITVRFKKCGETVNRPMVARVCRYYEADAEEVWLRLIEPFGGPENVSPEFQMHPNLLNPRIQWQHSDT
jgi:hypothetical protein